MGNCQAIDANTVVIQHPGGGVERLSWPLTAGEVMNKNSGHSIGLIMFSKFESERSPTSNIRVTRVKILRPKDHLLPGQMYRLIPTKDVIKGLRARKYGKIKKNRIEVQGLKCEADITKHLQMDKNNLGKTEEKRRTSSSSIQSATSRSRQWRPSLYSISEVSS